ncbi:MAG TPA: hypothetical protein VGN64_02510 [Dyadobacter sp.]|jgi:hypothetical protein|nr:hypothetical protein [Dyadobacter sp.]
MLRNLFNPIPLLVALTTLVVMSIGDVAAQATANAIVTENALPGNPSTEWDGQGSGDLSFQGFATDISYNKGTTAVFKIKRYATSYTLSIYRLGYYQGNGARLVGQATVSATLPQSQPACVSDPVTGLLDCGNWDVSAHGLFQAMPYRVYTSPGWPGLTLRVPAISLL